MARTIAQIQQALLDQVAADSTLSTQLTSTSSVAIWRLWTYVVAVCQWTLEVLFDQHKSDINAILSAQRPHTYQWYATMAKAFQYGYSLVADSNTYAVIDPTAQVVTYAACVAFDPKGIKLKVATGAPGSLAPLSSPQFTAFQAYMQLVKDAGVRIYFVNQPADSLLLNLNIYYDATVLDGTGARLDGTASTPVKDAINNYLANLPFNGLYTNFALLNAIVAVDGVVIPDLVSAQGNFYGSSLPYVNIDPQYNPQSGYLAIVNPSSDLTITYYPHQPLS